MAENLFIQIPKNDSECRCCGKGKEIVCDSCYDFMNNGYLIYIELKDQSTIERIKPARNVVATKAHLWKDPETGKPFTPGFAFIKMSDLKLTMKHEYPDPNRYKQANRFINRAPERSEHRAIESSRRAVELSIDGQG
jgi:hypothetical protein